AQLNVARRPCGPTDAASLASKTTMEPRKTIASPRPFNTVKRAMGAGLLLVTGAVARGAPAPDTTYASHLMVDQEVVVCGRVTGTVESINVDRGSVVTQGQILANLDPREFEAEVKQAKEDMDLKKAESDRAATSTASKLGSPEDLEEKRAQGQVAVASWEKAKATREYAVVRAPFSGIFTEKYARIGQKVIEDRSEPLFKITATEPLL